MPDPIFADERLARIYDPLDPDRSDLDAYVAIVEEYGARSVLDIGCGTGTLALLLAGRGIDVVGVDPARASLDVARGKPGADRVTWLHGDATTLPPLRVDVATMTGNVAQVFLTDDDWYATLRGVHAALAPGGRLVFESRVPQRRAWEQWTREHSWRRTGIDGAGNVVSWVDTLGVHGDKVTFRWTYEFENDGTTLTSDSTLRFRDRAALTTSLRDTGFTVDEVRDAPDRPGLEYVFLARRPA
jgi:SAM-dependent methyltransferase